MLLLRQFLEVLPKTSGAGEVGNIKLPLEENNNESNLQNNRPAVSFAPELEDEN